MTAAPGRDRDDRVRAVGRTVSEIVLGGALALGYLVLSPLLRRAYNRWGATDEELTMPMPGDELVARPKLGYTRAITIEAPPGAVWPWLVQFGQGRGGFYSFDGLENLVGCRIHSVDEILEDEQDPDVGDLIRSGPQGKQYAAWQILDIDAPHHLVLMGADPGTGEAPNVVDAVPERGYAGSTWQWLLRPVAGGAATRLVVRQRLTYSPNQRLLWRLVEPLNFVMERRMLRGIERRAGSHRSAAHQA
jgi:hypothetical protein